MSSSAQLAETNEEKIDIEVENEKHEPTSETKIEHIIHEVQHELHDIKEEIEHEIEHEVAVARNLRKDLTKILLLVYLYFLQGIPLGLSVSVPFLLTTSSVSYSDQGTFSFAGWPFAIKLLWAPIVDSIYYYKFGRRKSWLIPTQLFIGGFMLIFATSAKTLIETGQTNSDIIFLTSIFFILNFLAATQDICVDGWAITMLSEENVSWQSTCNNVGQSMGMFVSNTLFIILESTSFSNKYIRPLFGLSEQTHGLINIQMFMMVFGVVFLVTTILVMLFKNENGTSTLCFMFKKKADKVDNTNKKEEEIEAADEQIEDFEHEKMNLISTYITIFRIFKLIPIRKIAFFLLTAKIAFAVNSVLFLKFIEAGVTKEIQTLMDIPLTTLSIIWALIISRYINGNKSLIYHVWLILTKIGMSLAVSVFVYFLYAFKNASGEFEWYFFLTFFIINGIDKMISTTMFITLVSFYAKVADQNIGGTYMTLLATLSNLGTMYPSTLGLFIVNWLTKKNCSFDNYSISNGTFISNSSLLMDIGIGQNATYASSPLILANNVTVDNYVNKCSTSAYIKECTELGGECVTLVDAYYYLVGVFSGIGVIWILGVYRMIRNLNNLPKSEWKMKIK